MREKWGKVLVAVLISVMILGVPLSCYATESKNLGEMVPMIFGYDSAGNPTEVAIYATPILIDEQTTLFITTAYMCEVEHSGGYAIFYYQNGEVVGAPVECIYENKDVGYAVFRTSDGTNTGLGLGCANMSGITENSLIGYMGYADDGSLNLLGNYCSGNADGVGWFATPCVNPAYGGPVVETESYYAIGVTITDNLFITMEQVWADLDSARLLDGGADNGSSGSNSGNGGSEGNGGTDSSGGTGGGTTTGGSNSDGGIPLIAIVAVVGAGAGVFFYLRKKKEKDNAGSGASSPSDGTANSLVGVGGEHAGLVIPINEPIVFGRDKNRCNMMFPSTAQGISSLHCQVSKINGKIEVTDLGSTYGTFLDNGTKLTPHVPQQLMPGQGFYLADRKYSYRIQ